MVGKGVIKCAKCGLNSKENSSLTFHRFPLPSKRCGSLKAQTWAKFCYPNEDWTSYKSLEKLCAEHKMLCGNHFDESSYTSSDRKRLNKFAVPTEAQNILTQLRHMQNITSRNTQELVTKMNILKDLDNLKRKCLKCGASPREDSEIKLYRFPKPGTRNARRCEMWAKYCFPDQPWSSPVFQRKLNAKHMMLCNKHFKDSEFLSISEKKLAKHAVPDLTCKVANVPHETWKQRTEKIKDIALYKKYEATTQNKKQVVEPSVNNENEGVQTLSTNDVIEEGQTCSIYEDIETDETGLIDVPEEEDKVEEEECNFSWKPNSELVNLSQGEVDDTFDDDIPDNLSMYCDEDVCEAPDEYSHKGFHCNNCSGDIVGFRYTCVQCSDYDLCTSCERNSVHIHHYMLRVPGPKPYYEVETVLARIRKFLMSELDPISAGNLDCDDVISVKSEIKSENEDIEPCNEPDDLQNDITVDQNIQDDVIVDQDIHDSIVLIEPETEMENDSVIVLEESNAVPVPVVLKTFFDKATKENIPSESNINEELTPQDIVKQKPKQKIFIKLSKCQANRLLPIMPITNTPIGRNVMPVERTVMPVEETMIPDKRKITDVPNTATPVEIKMTEVERTMTKVNRTFTPVKRTITQGESAIAPFERTITPGEITIIPVTRTMTKVETMMTQVKRTMTPIERTMIPVEETMSQVDRMIIPVTRTILPVEKTVTHVERTITPVEKRTNKRSLDVIDSVNPVVKLLRIPGVHLLKLGETVLLQERSERKNINPKDKDS